MTVVVGICGTKFHGKDTAANALIETFGFRRMAFADGLKDVLAKALCVERRFFDDPELKETIHKPSGKTYRAWAQIAGTDWFRTMWGDIWVDYWRNEVMSHFHDLVVVPDMRFPNELVAVAGFKRHMLLRIVNPRIPASGDTHESERYASTLPVDYEIYNSTSIDDLQLAVNAVYRGHIGCRAA